MKPMVYVAGPISSNPMHGTHAALELATRMLDDDVALPFVPHLTVLWDIVYPRHYETWMKFDIEVIEFKCDAVFRLQGESPGADREVQHARNLELPVFGSPDMHWLLFYDKFTQWCEAR